MPLGNLWWMTTTDVGGGADTRDPARRAAGPAPAGMVAATPLDAPAAMSVVAPAAVPVAAPAAEPVPVAAPAAAVADVSARTGAAAIPAPTAPAPAEHAVPAERGPAGEPVARPGSAPGGPRRPRLRWPVEPGRLIIPGVVLIVVAGAVLRFLTDAHLWLDEALTVEIASRPLTGGHSLFEALRHDGAPPLYYLLLHFWMKVFGNGDVAVRSLSGVLSIATLPFAWFAGRQVGRVASTAGNGPRATADRAGIAALLLFATSPYAIRYGDETRMYSLVVLVVLIFGLLLARALAEPTWRRFAPVPFATAALVYTHYWTFLLLASVAAFLLVQMRRRRAWGPRCWTALGSMFAAVVLFAPWLPTFAFQMLHTGTPWAQPVHAQVLLDTIFAWAGPESIGALLGIILIVAALVGLTARPSGDLLVVDPRGRVPGRYLFALFFAPLVLAYFAYVAGGSAYTERYTGIALPAFLLLAALGLGLLPNPKMLVGLLVVASITGLVGGWQLVRVERTQAGAVAAKIAGVARPGDVVAYCPDQLGPAVYRALTRSQAPELTQIAFADTSGPALVDWVDYADRMRDASGADFAARVNRLAGPNHAVFLVRADGYRTLEGACAVISDQLAAVRDRTQLISRRALLEGSTLERFSTNR